MSSRSWLFLLVITIILFETVSPRRYYVRSQRRRHRRMPMFPARVERARLDCRAHEHFVRCGPERHCEPSCDNLDSPPNCVHNFDNPKCFHPRCVCNDGYVRDARGACVRDDQCPEAAMMIVEDELDDGDTVYQFERIDTNRKLYW